MARRPRVFAPGLLYHVIARGNHRQKTFLHEQDYQAYLERIAKYRRKHGVVIHAYCLMPNHVHLLLETTVEPLAKFMQGVQQSYTQYFNRVHNKVGHLFQGRYKAIVCEKEPYLFALIRYIHLNPVRAKLVRLPEQYPYSGHRVYLTGNATNILDPAGGLAWFGGRGAYQRFVRDGLAEGHQDEYYAVEDQRFLGTEGFGKQVQAEREDKPEQAAKRPLESALKALAASLKVEPAVLRSPDRGWRVSRLRTLAAYTLVRRCGYGVSEVAACLGRDAATISSLLSRIAGLMQTDLGTKKEATRLAKIVEI